MAIIYLIYDVYERNLQMDNNEKKNIPHTQNNQNNNILIQVENLKTNTVCDFKTIRSISQSSCRKSTSRRKRFIFLLWSDKKKENKKDVFRSWERTVDVQSGFTVQLFNI